MWSKEIILPPAEVHATKRAVDAFTTAIDELEDYQRIEFLTWKNDQGFEWPWTVAALKAMEAKLNEIVGAGDPPSEATAPADLSPDPDAIRAGDSGEPETSGTSAAAPATSPETGTLLDDTRPF